MSNPNYPAGVTLNDFSDPDSALDGMTPDQLWDLLSLDQQRRIRAGFWNTQQPNYDEWAQMCEELEDFAAWRSNAETKYWTAYRDKELARDEWRDVMEMIAVAGREQ